jgi:SAM-dependent methyltransferase
MTMPRADENVFDGHAQSYDADLTKGIKLSGESKEFFAEERIIRLSHEINVHGRHPDTLLDFGCGVGTATPFFLKYFPDIAVTGVDVSRESISIAKKSAQSIPSAQFFTLDEFQPRGNFDLAFCNGVFHHIPPFDRPAALSLVRENLSSEGLFSFWENNPYNPGTRMVMSRIEFDRDAITLSAGAAVKLLKTNGFEPLSVMHWFIFPSFLKRLRILEPQLSRFPLGAQYHVLCEKR